MDKELIDFLIEAKKQTYVNENVKKNRIIKKRFSRLSL